MVQPGGSQMATKYGACAVPVGYLMQDYQHTQTYTQHFLRIKYSTAKTITRTCRNITL